jgi:hypothetical protein
LILFCHSEIVLNDRIFFETQESYDPLILCSLNEIIDIYWSKPHLKTLYFWNFCCSSPNADVVCAERNYSHLRDSEVERYGVKMRSLIYDRNIPITQTLIRGVLQYFKEHALEGHFKSTALFSNAREESFLSHIMGYDEVKYAENVTEIWI